MKTTSPREYLAPDLTLVGVEPASHLAQVISPPFIPEEYENESEPGSWENS